MPIGEGFFLSVASALGGAVCGLELHHRATQAGGETGIGTYFASCSRLLAAVPYLFLQEI